MKAGIIIVILLALFSIIAYGSTNTDQTDLNCDRGLMNCNGICVDIMTNSANCGACGLACSGEDVCNVGVCSCSMDKMKCNGKCVDTSYDPQNCGKCGMTCSAAN